MDQYSASELTTTYVYAFDSATGELSYAVMRLPLCPGSRSAGPKAHVYAPISLNPDLRTHGLGEASSEIVEEIPTPGGQTVHFVAKSQTRAPPGQGFVDAQDHRIWSAKQQVMEVERLVWQLEAALAEDGEFDYEGDVDEFDYEDKILSFEDDDCEFDCGLDVEFIGSITDYPAASVDQDSEYALGSDIIESLSSDSSQDSVTFDPPSSSVSAAEELVPSTTSAVHLSTPSQITLPLGSALHSESATGDSSAVAGDTSLYSLSQPDSSCGDASLFLGPLAERAGPGCPPTEEEPFCPACYRMPIRLVWGNEPSDESLSDLVNDLLGEDEFPYEACTPGTAQPQVDTDIPTHPPIVAADWSLSHALVSLGCGAVPGASTSSSAGSLFSGGRPAEARTGCDSESEDEPLAETVKRRRDTPKRRRKTIKRRRETGSAVKGKQAPTPETPRARRVPASDQSAEVPLSTLRALRVEQRKEHGRTMADSQSPRLSTGSSATVQQEPPSRRCKRRRDDEKEEDEKEEGEISEYESDSQESDPDVPLAHVLASRGRSQSTLGHGPPPAKRVRFTPAVDSPRRLSRDGGRSHRSWPHRRWEERLMQRHAWAGQEGRRGMRVMSTEEDQLRRGVRTAKAAH